MIRFARIWLVGLAVVSMSVLACSSSKRSPAASETVATQPSQLQVQTLVIKDQTPLYTIDVQYPQLGFAGDPQIKQVVDDTIADLKRSVLDYPPQSGQQYSLDGKFDPPYVGTDVVSVRLTLSSYTGGAHGATAIHGLTFDRAGTRQLTTDDALSLTGLTLAQVADQTTTQLKAKFGSALFPQGATADPKNYAAFVVDADKVTFIFQEYQVAPYAAGPQEVSFPRKPVR